MRGSNGAKSGIYASGHTDGKSPALQFDVAHFDKILNRPDISKELRHQALKELWSLISLCLDVGWGIHDADENGGQERAALTQSPRKSRNMLSSSDHIIAQAFIEATTEEEVTHDAHGRHT